MPVAGLRLGHWRRRGHGAASLLLPPGSRQAVGRRAPAGAPPREMASAMAAPPEGPAASRWQVSAFVPSSSPGSDNSQGFRRPLLRYEGLTASASLAATSQPPARTTNQAVLEEILWLWAPELCPAITFQPRILIGSVNPATRPCRPCHSCGMRQITRMNSLLHTPTRQHRRSARQQGHSTKSCCGVLRSDHQPSLHRPGRCL